MHRLIVVHLQLAENCFVHSLHFWCAFSTIVESCSMDTLRNAVKSLVDMSVICYRNTTQISVYDADQLMEIAESIIDFKS